MLNLLPPEIKHSRQTRSLLYSVTFTYILIIIGASLCLVGLATWNFIQQAEVGNKQGRVEELNAQKRAKGEIVRQASFVEDRINSAANFQEDKKWDEVLRELAANTPTDTTLASVNLTRPAAKTVLELSIGGSTSDRRSIVLFRDKLEASETFSATTILSLSEKIEEGKKSFSFTLSATYTPAKEKKP